MTRRDRDLLTFLKVYQSQNGGLSPSYQEIADGIGAKSKSVIFRLVEHLIRDGLLKRGRGSCRSLEVVSTTIDMSSVSDAEISREFARRFIPISNHGTITPNRGPRGPAPSAPNGGAGNSLVRS